MKKKSGHQPKDHLHFDKPFLEEEIRKCLNEAE
jgi:hypothetical protein